MELNSSITELSVAVITGVLGPLIIIYIQKYWGKLKKNNLAESIKLSNNIQEKIESLRENIGADQIWISQFHNGGNFYPTGKSIQKLSATYEAVSENQYSLQSILQNFPISLFNRMFKILVERSYLEVHDMDDKNSEKHGLENLLSINGTKSTYVFAITTLDNKFIGNLHVSFIKNTRKFTDEEIRDLMIFSSALGGVMNNYLKNT